MGFLSKLLGVISGNSGMKMSDQLLFDKIIGFRGIVPGVGTSTIVQNVAVALAESTNFSICVLDTHYLYPTQYPMLVANADNNRKDYLDFNGELSDITVPTAFRNVHLLSLSNRTIIDMMSSRDSELTVDKLIGALKSFFDVILVDLSYEMTNINTHTAIKCNRIINVADQSLKCVYNMRKSLNTMATLAIPLAKANKLVLNKVISDVLTNTKGVIEEAGLLVVGEIPFSKELATAGVSGKKIWTKTTSSKDVHAFSAVINSIVDDIVQVTPLNEKYVNPSAVEEAKKQVGSSTVVDDSSEGDIGEFVNSSSKGVTEPPTVEEPVAEPVTEKVLEVAVQNSVIEEPVIETATEAVAPESIPEPAPVEPTPAQSSGSLIIEEDIEEEIIGSGNKNSKVVR